MVGFKEGHRLLIGSEDQTIPSVEFAFKIRWLSKATLHSSLPEQKMVNKSLSLFSLT